MASYITSGKSLARIEGKDSVALVVLHPNSLFVSLDLLIRSRFKNLEYGKLAMYATLLLSLIFCQTLPSRVLTRNKTSNLSGLMIWRTRKQSAHTQP